MIEVVTAISLWEHVKHLSRWEANLKRAKDYRKKESIYALRRVVIAARKTAVYVRQLEDTGEKSHHVEVELSILWTKLWFALDDLGTEKLAKRCRIKGIHWEHPGKMDKEYLRKADVSLVRMEQIANIVLREINC
jgi:hypothetical protein